MKLSPVILPVPQAAGRSPRQVRHQRQYARLALRHCATRCGAPLTGWKKDGNDVPRPNGRYYWSVAHKRRWAVGVIADAPVGVDIERIVSRRNSLHDALADDREWSVVGDRSWHSFFRLWTAKEAALKANGRGISGFPSCRLIQVADDRTMTLEFNGRSWIVEHFYHAGHVAAVTRGSDPVTWLVLEQGEDVAAPPHRPMPPAPVPP